MPTSRSRARCRGPQKVVVAGVGGVGGQPGGDAPAGRALPALDELSGPVQHRLPLVAEDGPTQGGAGAGLLHCPGRPVHVKVVVGDAGDAGLDHLGQSQQHAPIHVFLLQVALQGPHVFVEPLFQRHIFGQPAEDDHRHVGVGVDEARHGDHAIGLDELTGAVEGDGPRRLHGGDAVAFDGNVVIALHAQVAVGGDLQHVGLSNQQVEHKRPP